jgi:hypothetical protein
VPDFSLGADGARRGLNALWAHCESLGRGKGESTRPSPVSQTRGIGQCPGVCDACGGAHLADALPTSQDPTSREGTGSPLKKAVVSPLPAVGAERPDGTEGGIGKGRVRGFFNGLLGAGVDESLARVRRGLC